MKFSGMEKIGFGVLVTAWVVWGTNQIGNKLVHADMPEKMGYDVAVADEGPKEVAKVVEVPVMELLASADVNRGAKVFKKCAACHTSTSGGKHKVGPNLWNVVGRAKAKAEGYKYSSALAGLGSDWTFENLDKFLLSPKAYAPGNKMTFKGISKNSDRAALIVYMQSLSDNPVALPK